MVRKNRQQKSSALQNESNSKESDDDDDSQDELKCKYCDNISATVIEKEQHEKGCEAKATAKVFNTPDGKLQFLCSVSIFMIKKIICQKDHLSFSVL